MKDDIFYVGIEEPTELRRKILMGSKTLIDSLRRYEAYRELRAEKLAHIVQLKRLMDEIMILNKKLRSLMPGVQIPQAAPEEAEASAPEPRAARKQKHAPVLSHKSKLDLLQDQLSQIEKKLSSLE
jgi:hypothetical protein